MTRPLPDQLLWKRRMIRALTLSGVIRLVTEIDDNGPVGHERGSLQGAFGDLTPGQLRHALDTACALGLVHADEHNAVRYVLTHSGEDLAEVYDTAARWARAHHVPNVTSDFVSRVQHTLHMQHIGTDQTASASELPVPQQALTAWLQANLGVLRHAESPAADARRAA